MGGPLFDDALLKRLEAGRWLVGVSGGGDSVALLRMLVDAGLQDRVVVGNFNHGWGRFGQDSQRFVEKFCKELGVTCCTGHGSGKAATNAEAVARDERYTWMAEVCRGESLDGVLVAHTADDQVETFLMRIGKGSSLQGLVGMKVESLWQEMVVMRPLLDVRRDDLRGYLRELRQEWMEDPDNEDGGSQRARVRRLLPLLEAAGVGVIGMTASVKGLGDANRVVERAVDDVQVTWLPGNEAEVELAVLREVLPEVGARVLGRLMERLVPDAGVVRRGKRIGLLAKLKDGDAGHATLGGLKFEWGAGLVKVRPEK